MTTPVPKTAPKNVNIKREFINFLLMLPALHEQKTQITHPNSI
jgi:hypothetical protein